MYMVDAGRLNASERAKLEVVYEVISDDETAVQITRILCRDLCLEEMVNNSFQRHAMSL